MKLNWRLVFHVVYWFTILTALYGSWQMSYQLAALDPGHHPIWSGAIGSPVPHHWLWGSLLNFPAYILLTRRDWVLASRKLYMGLRSLNKVQGPLV